MNILREISFLVGLPVSEKKVCYLREKGNLIKFIRQIHCLRNGRYSPFFSLKIGVASKKYLSYLKEERHWDSKFFLGCWRESPLE